MFDFRHPEELAMAQRHDEELRACSTGLPIYCQVPRPPWSCPLATRYIRSILTDLLKTNTTLLNFITPHRPGLVASEGASV